MAENEPRCENSGSFLDAVLAAAARGTITEESALRLIFLNQEQLAMLERQYRERWLFESNGLSRLSLFYLRDTELAA